MKNNLVTYWTVKANGFGWDEPIDLYFKEYKNAKEESFKNYRDKPIKHTVKPEKIYDLPYDILED